MVNKLEYSVIPFGVVYISSSNGMVPLPVIEYSLVKNQTAGSDKLSFKCTLDQFPTSVYNQIFVADARSGRFVVELYSGYTHYTNLFTEDENGEFKYDISKLGNLRQLDNFRFYGLIDFPKLKMNNKSNTIEFEASDYSYFLDQIKVVGSYKNMKAVDLIKKLTDKFDIIKIKINQGANSEAIMGQKSSKQGSDEFIYNANNVSVWKIIQDCAKKMGETVRIDRDTVVIGFEHPDVNSFQYIFGENMEDISMYRDPKISDKDIYVEIVSYDRENKRVVIGSAGKYTSVLFDSIINSSKDQKSAKTDNSKQSTTRIFRYYMNDLKNKAEAEKIAQNILKDILYKRWKFSFETIGNPYINPDDNVRIDNLLGWDEFKKIKWYVNKIDEKYSVDSFKSTITLSGVALDVKFHGLESENDYIEYSSNTQFPDIESTDQSTTEVPYEMPTGKRTINKLVIHHTACVTSVEQSVEDIRKIHQARGYSDIGYHKVILPSGVIKQGRPENRKGAHCYSQSYKKSWSVNSTSIGIALSGNFELEEPKTEQLDALKNLCLLLCKQYNIPSNSIYGHKDFMATACPGKNLYKYLSDIRTYVEQNR